MKFFRYFLKYLYFLIFIISIIFSFNILFSDIQFLPLFFRVINRFTFINITLFLIIIFITLISGRSYCQYLCPLGILQDILPELKIFKKFRILINSKKLKFILRIIFLIILISGFTAYVEPYSIFSKIVIYPVKSIFYLFYNYLILFLKRFDIFISPIKYNLDLNLFVINLIFFIILLVLNFYKKRFFCNFVCPAGTLLYCLSKYPLFRIEFSSKCVSCGLCKNICPTMAIDLKNRCVDNGECILCMKCVEKCKYNGLIYNLSRKDGIKKEFLLGLLLFPFIFLIKKNRFFLNRFFISEDFNKFIIPPGSISIDNIVRKCISCGLCIIQCPTKVIRFERYIPVLDYKNKYCLYECKRCGEVCPVDAIVNLNIKEKMLTKIGNSEFYLEKCIVYTNKTDCGACSEHCPTKACYMINYKDNLLIPEINKEICIGCGACEYVCPAKTKAIIVKSINPHQKAIEPSNNNREVEDLKDFPF